MQAADPLRFVVAPAGHLGSCHAAVAERTGGVSAPPFATLNVGRTLADDPGRIAENEQRILAALGLPDRVARLRLEHGARIVEAGEPGWYGPADALVSAHPGLVLWFTVADCYPVTLAAGPWRVHGHCGWRGTAAGLPGAMVEALRDRTPSLAEVKAWIGPGIGPCCYAIGPETAGRFPGESLRRVEGGAVHLDLESEIRRRLRAAGLPPAAIRAAGVCTACAPGRFFSHRRDGVPTGRHAALCWTAADPRHFPSSNDR